MAVRSNNDFRPEKKPSGLIESLGPTFGYEYLGPGTDVRYKQRHGVKPKGTLDREAMKHDIAYADIKDAYERGDITYEQALDKVDKADWELFKGAAGDFYRYKAPNALVGVAKAWGGPLGVAFSVGDAVARKKKAKTAGAAGVQYAIPQTKDLFRGLGMAELVKDAVSTIPTGYTSAAMLTKLALSKLGIKRGAYAGLKKRRVNR